MISKNKYFALVEIIVLFILPVLLLYFNIIPKNLRLWVLFIFSFFMVLIIIAEKWDSKKIGLRLDNLRHSLLSYLIFTVAGLMVLYFLSKYFGQTWVQNWQNNAHLTFFFLPISIAQEFAYRGYLVPRLKSLTNSIPLIIVANVALFAFLHIIYVNPLLTIFLGIISGIGFVLMYLRYPNLYLISLSHVILNFAAVYLGFFRI